MEGRVKSRCVSHKNGRTILRAGTKVTDKDVDNWSELVKKGHIEESKTTTKKAESKTTNKEG